MPTTPFGTYAAAAHRAGFHRSRAHGALIRRAIAVLTVLTVAGGCTARATEPSAGPGGSASAAPGRNDAGLWSPSGDPGAAPRRTAGARQSPGSSADTAPEPADALMRRGDSDPLVRELQARLAQIGWFDHAPTGFYGRITAVAVQGFQGRRGLPATGAVDPVTWRRLLAMTTAPTPDELSGTAADKPAARLDPRCLRGRVMCVSKTGRTLSWVVEGVVRSTMDVRFGSQYTPTREGTFTVFLKSRNHVSTLYDTPMPYAMFFSGGQAVHYSADFAARGYGGASHGCVNVRDRGAIAALFAEIRTGDRVVIHW
ncbi:L,D-transpeptidase family protein [Streptomyces sp. CAU 1734]|uniref:L,D-transpeptidase family protein n=1 Tax=Streptomyces sp. CAU 1734 TaxID=3140360 RepID=UPI00326193EC